MYLTFGALSFHLLALQLALNLGNTMPSLDTSISGSAYLREIWTQFNFFTFRPVAAKHLKCDEKRCRSQGLS